MKFKNEIKSKKLAVSLIGLALGCALFTAPALAKTADPFVGGTWHAIGETWPGTAKFSEKDKQVVLAPIGAAEIKATYSFAPAKVKKPGALNGKLTMTNALGQVVTSDFSISGNDKLSLTFSGGQRVETYVKFTPAQEAAEVRRIEQLIREGKLDSTRDAFNALGNSSKSVLDKGLKNIELP